MNCPYEALTFSNEWDYLAHLQKCHIINQKNIIHYICRKCLKVFECNEDLQEHKTQPHTLNWEKLFQNQEDRIQLARKGRWNLKHMMDIYRDQQNAPPEPQPPIILKPVDPRLHTPRDIVSKISQLTIDKKEKLRLWVMYQKYIESAYYRLFNHYTDISLINKDYPQKIEKRVLRERLKNYKLNQEVFERTKVCEFMELSISTNEDHCIYITSRTINKFEYLWLLVHEDANPFDNVSFTEPWMIFAIPLQLQKYKELVQQAPKQKIEFSELREQLQIQLNIMQQLEQEQAKIELHKIEENKLMDQKIKKLEQLETHLRIQYTNQTKQQNDYESLTKQLDSQYLDDYNDRIKKLDKYYLVQRENIQNDIVNQSEQYRSTDLLIKEKQKLILRVEHYTEKHNKMYYDTQELKRQITAIGEKLREEEFNRLKNQTKKQQKIVQHLCIKCNKNMREVIHFPCQHLLFCLYCFIQIMSEKKQQCPLMNIGQCRESRFIEKKAKSVKFKN